MRKTYRSGPRIGDPARVFRPLVVVSVFVGEGSVEDVAYVGHGVDAHRRALEHRARNTWERERERERMMIRNMNR